MVNMALKGISATPIHFYRREPHGFINVTDKVLSAPLVGVYSQAAASDIDNDGDLDVFIVGRGSEFSVGPFC